MPDERDAPEPEEEGGPGDGGVRGLMVYAALALIAILIILVVFMNFSGQGATAAVTITENPWQLRSIAAPDGTLAPLLNGTQVTASFSPDGTLGGSGGCNHYTARYLVRETLIVISPVTAGSAPCRDPDTALQESRYFAALGNAAELRVHDRTLTLYGTDGKPLLAFSPAPAGG